MRREPVMFGSKQLQGLRPDLGQIRVSEDEILSDLRYPAGPPSLENGGEAGQAGPASPRASETSRRTPYPVAPLPTYSRPTSHAVPAMSRCTHGFSSTNSSRNEAA